MELWFYAYDTHGDCSMIRVRDAIKELGYTNWVLYGEPTNETEFNEMFRVRADDGTESTDYPDGLTWDAINTKKTELEGAESITELRTERNKKLAETDWVVIKEREEGGSVSNFADWKTYRQALRDITNSATSLDDVTWPEKPE